MTACGGDTEPVPQQPTELTCDEQTYAEAVRDAAEPTGEDVYTGLWASYGFWQRAKSPWTGLGYTYDWCNAETHVGASEYVIRSGSTVTVTGKIERATYCAP